MPRYRVELEIQTATGRPDETFAATVDAENSEIALATAKVMALRNGYRGRLTLATCNRIEDDDPTVAGKRWTAPAPRRSLMPEQIDALETWIEDLAVGCPVRLALEMALASDRLAKTPEPLAHDFGKYGSADYCRRKDCQAKNQPPVNRWGCKGAA